MSMLSVRGQNTKETQGRRRRIHLDTQRWKLPRRPVPCVGNHHTMDGTIVQHERQYATSAREGTLPVPVPDKGCTVQVDDSDVFIAAIHDKEHSGENPWEATISVNGLPVKFKVDTRADVSVVPEATFQELQGVTLKPVSKSLTAPSRQSLHVCGQFTGHCTYGAREAEEEIFVVQGLQTALMGRPAIEALNLVSRINTVDDPQRKLLDKYAHLFQGLGTMEGEYHVKPCDDATPFAQMTPRRVALPLMPKV